MQVHASSGAALRAVHATPPAWLLDGAEVAHAGVGASLGALAYLADIAASPGARRAVSASFITRKKGNHVTFDVTAANTIRAQRLRAVASTPISEELADRVRRAN